MEENQHTEFKESWHDEYTRYISAFCNTEGGVLYIGIDDMYRGRDTILLYGFLYSMGNTEIIIIVGYFE